MLRLGGFDFNKNETAMRMATEFDSPLVKEAVDWIVDRARTVGGDETADLVKIDLEEKVKVWKSRAQLLTGGSRLGYQSKKDSETIGLLQKPGVEAWDEFTCLNSLRDVEPTALLILNDHNLDEQAEFMEQEADEGGDE